MKKILNYIFAYLVIPAALCAAIFSIAHAASTFTCTAGNISSAGNLKTQATISGTNNVTINTAGTLTLPATITGTSPGTAIVCAASNIGKNDVVGVYCDSTATIKNNAGCCGTASRNISAFTVKGVGGTTLNETPCLGIGNKVGTFKMTGTGNGDGTVTIGATMDATNARIGSSYTLANGSGKMAVTIKDETNPATYNTTADLSVVFDSTVGFSSTGVMDFKKVGYTGTPTGSDHVDLGTDGTTVSAGNFQGNAGTTAGQVTMNNVQNGVTLEVRCDSSVHLTNAAGTVSINVTGLKVAKEGSTGPYASAGSACAGSGAAGAATTLVYTSGTTDQFFFGGKLDGGTTTGTWAGGTYSSTNPGGTSAVVAVVNQ
jgi:hypothetical protein